MPLHTLVSRIQSLFHAARGVSWLFATQTNAKLHLAATVMVLVAGAYFDLSRGDWALVVIAVMVVWLAEGLNTAIELLADAVSTDIQPLLGRAKDVAAGAVLLAALGAAMIGLLVFMPHLAARFMA